MRRLTGIQLGSGGSFGAEVASDETPAPVGSTLPPADPQTISWAASFWPEVNPDEINWEPFGRRNMSVRHKQTGVEYRIETGLPVGGEFASGVSCFCIRDGRICLLADRPDKVQYVVHGHVTSREITLGRPPAEGQIW